LTAIKLRAPVLGGNFGVWGGLFSTFDCAVKGVRKKEDPYNAIIAGFFTGGALAVRGGAKAMRNGAIGCAILLAVIEGVGIGIGKYFAGATKLEVSLFLLLISAYCRLVISRWAAAAGVAERLGGPY
jgi:import inner membrane translocase subunit TIM17